MQPGVIFPHLLRLRGPQLREVRPLSQSHTGHSGAAWTLQPSLQTLSQCLRPHPMLPLVSSYCPKQVSSCANGFPFQICVSFHPRHYKLLEGDHIASCKIQQMYIELLLFAGDCVKWWKWKGKLRQSLPLKFLVRCRQSREVHHNDTACEVS